MGIEEFSVFKFFTTADGSPTLEIRSKNDVTEKMHNSNGAFSESLYLYGQAIEFALENQWPLKILSIGLGLGYNELIACSISLKSNVPIQMLDSFEIEPTLRHQFLSWLGVESQPLQHEFSSSYEDILKRCSETYAIKSEDIKSKLRKLYETQSWRVLKAFDFNEISNRRYTALFFDPFSKKANPEFWDERYLSTLLTQLADKRCVFSTYAATGALKRALKAAHFQVDLRPGFKGKRNSTFAWKSS